MLWHRQKQMIKRIYLFCDGGTGSTTQTTQRQAATVSIRKQLRNEATCSAAAIAFAPSGEILDWAWQQLSALTNNEAEYAGLILGLETAQRLHAQEAICILDSEVVVGQMEGRFRVHSRRLQRWHSAARKQERNLPSVRYCLVPREWNRLADGLVAQAGIPWPVLRTAIEERVDSRAVGQSGGGTVRRVDSG